MSKIRFMDGVNLLKVKSFNNFWVNLKSVQINIE